MKLTSIIVSELPLGVKIKYIGVGGPLICNQIYTYRGFKVLPYFITIMEIKGVYLCYDFELASNLSKLLYE
jgi:hypothetical protein